ncbi:hypothetical protein [Gryllotalpicola koreensis]|uniref:Uncharacterized protein n=1 Tax=Gryllotalpicola koreensis TaxID=993086 RepID=A0ABP8A355_9MICO
MRVELLVTALEDEKAAHRIAADAADRFRDVISEVLGLHENPGDDELVRQIRDLHGRTGPEPTRWRDFITGAKAAVEREGFRWRSDAALEGAEFDDEEPAQ